jgi:heme/copper-type cytochrome/quinol oxidase subunit 2
MENNEPKSNNMLLFVGIGAVVLLVAGVAILGLSGSGRKPAQVASTPQVESSSTTLPIATTPSASPAPTSSASAATTAAGVKVIAVEAGSFYYKPNEIRVKKGEKVKIDLTAVDMMHDFNIDALNVHLPITKSGTSSSVVFTADRTGVFEYYCSVGNHRARGQVGKLIVE